MNDIKILKNLRKDMILFLCITEIQNGGRISIYQYDFVKKRMLKYKKHMSIIKTHFRKLLVDEEIKIHTNYSCIESVNDTINIYLELISKIIDLL